jgi:tetratricopeptide (TPR) repeat protein
MKQKRQINNVKKTISFAFLMQVFLILSFPLFSQTAEEYFNYGMEKFKQRNFDSAVYYFDQAIALKADYADAVFRRGLAKDNSGKTKEAFDDYSLAISIEPKPVYYNNRGILRFVNGENMEAIADYDSAIALDPNYLIALFNKGRAFLDIEEFKQGCDCMREAYESGLDVAKDAVDYYCN